MNSGVPRTLIVCFFVKLRELGSENVPQLSNNNNTRNEQWNDRSNWKGPIVRVAIKDTIILLFMVEPAISNMKSFSRIEALTGVKTD